MITDVMEKAALADLWGRQGGPWSDTDWQIYVNGDGMGVVIKYSSQSDYQRLFFCVGQAI